mmetsp:Transcript_20157/g.43451  ORF Transcript_20157/g.43451 Transcript_20157/m.43451 type:complete len:85 (-) Transcript_20157:8-262(-)
MPGSRQHRSNRGKAHSLSAYCIDHRTDCLEGSVGVGCQVHFGGWGALNPSDTSRVHSVWAGESSRIFMSCAAEERNARILTRIA